MLDRQAQRQKEQSVAPHFNVVEDYRGSRIEQDHPDFVVAHSLLKEELGTADEDFCRGLLAQLSEFDAYGDASVVETEFNFLLSVIKSRKPKDELEAMLLALIGKSFHLPMRITENFASNQRDVMKMRRDMAEKDPSVLREIAAIIKTLPQLQESSERSFNRCTRTFAILLETLYRLRWSSEPSMTVQQLTVAQGGQAIVGNVTHATPHTAPNNPTAGPRVLTDQQHSAMPIIGKSDRVKVPARRRRKMQ